MASILLIDDDEDLRLVTAVSLRSAGHAVVEAVSGREGLASYRAGRYDLVITDIVMPDIEGIELITALRKEEPRPRVIAMSGYSDFSASLYLPAALKLGAQCTLTKPFTPDVLLRAVEEILAAPVPSAPSREPPVSEAS